MTNEELIQCLMIPKFKGISELVQYLRNELEPLFPREIADGLSNTYYWTMSNSECIEEFYEKFNKIDLYITLPGHVHSALFDIRYAPSDVHRFFATRQIVNNK